MAGRETDDDLGLRTAAVAAELHGESAREVAGQLRQHGEKTLSRLGKAGSEVAEEHAVQRRVACRHVGHPGLAVRVAPGADDLADLGRDVQLAVIGGYRDGGRHAGRGERQVAAVGLRDRRSAERREARPPCRVVRRVHAGRPGIERVHLGRATAQADQDADLGPHPGDVHDPQRDGHAFRRHTHRRYRRTCARHHKRPRQPTVAALSGHSWCPLAGYGQPGWPRLCPAIAAGAKNFPSWHRHSDRTEHAAPGTSRVPEESRPPNKTG